MKLDVAEQNAAHNAPPISEVDDAPAGVDILRQPEDGVGAQVEHVGPEIALTAVNPSELRRDQYRAFDIITWHLEQTIAGADPPPLRMILYGEGGTGKSKVIQTVTEVFAARGVKHLIGHIPIGSERVLSDESRAHLQEFWRHRQYLIIDEYSMIGKSFLALLERNITVGKAESAEGNHLSFGGLNVILCGDLHQFPPVAQSPSEALYRPLNLAEDDVNQQIGRRLYEDFTTVVILKEQMRVTDPVWREFLVHLRKGEVQDRHLGIMHRS